MSKKGKLIILFVLVLLVAGTYIVFNRSKATVYTGDDYPTGPVSLNDYMFYTFNTNASVSANWKVADSGKTHCSISASGNVSASDVTSCSWVNNITLDNNTNSSGIEAKINYYNKTSDWRTDAANNKLVLTFIGTDVLTGADGAKYSLKIVAKNFNFTNYTTNNDYYGHIYIVPIISNGRISFKETNTYLWETYYYVLDSAGNVVTKDTVFNIYNGVSAENYNQIETHDMLSNATGNTDFYMKKATGDTALDLSSVQYRVGGYQKGYPNNHIYTALGRSIVTTNGSQFGQRFTKQYLQCGDSCTYPSGSSNICATSGNCSITIDGTTTNTSSMISSIGFGSLPLIEDPLANEKTAKWVDEDTKEEAEITIKYYKPKQNRILWLGTLCNGHSLASGQYELAAMDKILKSNTIDYAFLGYPAEEIPPSTTATGFKKREDTYTAISTYNKSSAYQGVIYGDYTYYDITHNNSSKQVYLLDKQKVSGTKLKGSTMGVTYLNQMKNNTTGTGPNPDVIDYAHIWGGYYKNTDYRIFDAAGGPAFDNATLMSRANVSSVTTLHFTDDYIWSEGGHANAVSFADEINSKVTSDYKYDFIVMSFDGLFEMANHQKIINSQAQKMRNAAEKLAYYYTNKKVLWLLGSDSTGNPPSLVFKDDSNWYPSESGYTTTQINNFKSLYNISNAKYINTATGYGDSTGYTYLTQSPIKYNYMDSAFNDQTHLAKDTVLPRFYYTRNMYQTMALFDPNQYIDSTDSTGTPTRYPANPDDPTQSSTTYKWTTSIGNRASRYVDADQIASAISAVDGVKIEDIVASGLTPTGVDVYYWDGTQYVQLTSSGYTYTTTSVTGGTKVTVNVDDLDALNAPLKLIIHTDADSCFDNSGNDKDTNVGMAAVYRGEETTADQTYPSPTLSAKKFKVTTSSTGSGSISTNPSPATNLNGGSSVTVTYIPASGYKIASLTIDGVSQDISSCDGSNPAAICRNKTFSSICEDHNVQVAFTEIVENVTIKKEVKGTAASLSEYFPISIRIHKAGTFTIEGYTQSATCDGNTNPSTNSTDVTIADATTPTSKVICMKDGDTVVIKNVPLYTNVELEELNEKGYTASKSYYLCADACQQYGQTPALITTDTGGTLISDFMVLQPSTYNIDDINELKFINRKDKPATTGIKVLNTPYKILIFISFVSLIVLGTVYPRLKKETLKKKK